MSISKKYIRIAVTYCSTSRHDAQSSWYTTPGLCMRGWGLLGGPTAVSVSGVAWSRCRSQVASGFSVLSLICVTHIGGLE